MGGKEPKVTYFSRRGDDICHIACQKSAKKPVTYFVNHPKYLHLMQCMVRKVIENKFLTMFNSIHTAICDLNSLIKSNERCLKKVRYFSINNIEPPLMPPSPPPISPMLLADLKF